MADTFGHSRIRVNHFVVSCIVAFLPVFGLVFCVVWSILYDFEQSTRTHCKVPNYLPSISAAIGSFTPQRYVWRTCIGLHSAPRFMLAVAYYNFHMSVELSQNTTYSLIAFVACFLHIVENLTLLGLTYVSSSENYEIHKKFFITFLASSLFYMLLTVILIKWGRTYRGRIMTPTEKYSFKAKLILFLFNMSCCFSALYAFWRHNAYCEPGAYTVFALSEYLVVFSNITYHFLWMTSDIGNTEWIITGYKIKVKSYNAIV